MSRQKKITAIPLGNARLASEAKKPLNFCGWWRTGRPWLTSKKNYHAEGNPVHAFCMPCMPFCMH